MTDVWATGTWTIKPGRDAEFVEAWREFAEWSDRTYGPARAWLLRHRDRAGVFVSLGPWPSDAVMGEWRTDPGFRERIGRIRDLIESVEIGTLDPVVTIGG